MRPPTDDLTIVRADEVAPQPWKNGGGVTRELLRLPLPGGRADEWLLRISLADIEADGPFSAFPGIRRSFAVLSGNGVHLDWPVGSAFAGRTTMTPGSQVLDFDGAQAPECRLVDGPTRDLNVMTRSAHGDAYVRPAAFGAVSLSRLAAAGVFTLEPVALVRGADRIELPPLTLAWDPAPDTRASWSLAQSGDATPASRQTTAGAPPAYWIGLLKNRETDSATP